MAYYTLLERSLVEGTWSVQFGDRDRETVRAELDDAWEGIKRDTPRKDLPRKAVALRIIRTTTAHQREIDAAVRTLNETAAAEWLAEFAP